MSSTRRSGFASPWRNWLPTHRGQVFTARPPKPTRKPCGRSRRGLRDGSDVPGGTTIIIAVGVHRANTEVTPMNSGMQKLKLSLIRSEMELQPRALLRYDLVDDYTRDLENGAAFPPI